ncbi:MAG TPA: hypothetical protein VK433_01290 [Stellaceae bacterium]|nr:hypothetical protein [Stellaceae bacterium]
MKSTVPEAVRRLVEFLGELGPRWGLPPEPCRVHAYLYLRARPAGEDELQAALSLDEAALARALTWLREYRLVEAAPGGAWRTGSDPWELMLSGLEERRRREAGPALALLRECRDLAAEERRAEPEVYAQVGKLLELAEDLTAIDGQARRLSPQALRQMLRLGGRAARLVERTLGRRGE